MAEPEPSPPPRASHASDAEGNHSAAPAPADAHVLFVKQLFESHRQALMGYLVGLLKRRADAEDVVQESYARLLGVAELDRSGSRARGYLFKIATNLAYDRFRRRAEQTIDTLADDELASNDESPERIVDFAQGLAIVKRTLQDLKPRCRQVFLLRVSEELGYEAIAARLGVSKRTVEREMQHALEVCQRRLKRS